MYNILKFAQFQPPPPTKARKEQIKNRCPFEHRQNELRWFKPPLAELDEDKCTL